MSGVADAMFACVGCGKSYRWKQELAGRKVKCKCGQVMDCPSTAPAPPEPSEEDGLYGFADEDLAAAAKGAAVSDSALCPSCQAEMQSGAVLCTNCGFNLKIRKNVMEMAKAKPAKAPKAAPAGGGAVTAASPLLGYAGTGRKQQDNPDDVKENLWIEYWIPTGLIIVGTLLNYLQITHYDRVLYDTQGAIKFLGITLLIDLALLIVGALAAIKMMNISLGSPGSALLKLAAVAIGPAALGNMIGYLAHDPSHMLAFAINILTVIALLRVFFDLDSGEAWVLAAMVAVIRTWLGYALILLLINGGIGYMPHLAPAELNSDREASDAIDNGWTTDGKQWLDASSNHMFGKSVHQWSLDLDNSLLNDGCKQVVVRTSGPYATVLYAELPSDKAKRKACFDAAALYYKQIDEPLTPVDKGQSYLNMPMD